MGFYFAVVAGVCFWFDFVAGITSSLAMNTLDGIHERRVWLV
jgi:hypothetical protein